MVSAFLQISVSTTGAMAAAAATALAALLICSAATLPAHAQPAPAAAENYATPATPAGQDFPADAEALSVSELDARLRGKVYTATLANGLRWRGDYKASGYVFFNMGNDSKWSGAWRTEDGKVCVDYRGPARTSCTEMRSGAQQALYAKSATTGVVTVLLPE